MCVAIVRVKLLLMHVHRFQVRLNVEQDGSLAIHGAFRTRLPWVMTDRVTVLVVRELLLVY